jgi:hypothetical protein
MLFKPIQPLSADQLFNKLLGYMIEKEFPMKPRAGERAGIIC